LDVKSGCEREAVPQVDRSIKDYSLIRKVIGAYDPAEVATLISPKETMGGDNYIWGRGKCC